MDQAPEQQGGSPPLTPLTMGLSVPAGMLPVQPPGRSFADDNRQEVGRRGAASPGCVLEVSVPPQGLELGSGDQEEQIITQIRLSFISPISPDWPAIALWTGAVPIE